MDGQGIQVVLPVGPDGLPLASFGAAGSPGSGNGAPPLEVKVTNSAVSGATKVRQVTLELGTARAAAAVDLAGIATVYAFTVRRLSGADAGSVRVHVGGPAEPGLAVDEGESREGIIMAALAVSNPGGGGTLQLEIYGA